MADFKDWEVSSFLHFNGAASDLRELTEKEIKNKYENVFNIEAQLYRIQSEDTHGFDEYNKQGRTSFVQINLPGGNTSRSNYQLQRPILRGNNLDGNRKEIKVNNWSRAVPARLPSLIQSQRLVL